MSYEEEGEEEMDAWSTNNVWNNHKWMHAIEVVLF